MRPLNKFVKLDEISWLPLKHLAGNSSFLKFLGVDMMFFLCEEFESHKLFSEDADVKFK